MGSQVRPGRQGPADDSKGPQSMGRSGALLPSGGAGSVQGRTVGPRYHARGDRAARHQAAVLASLQDAFPPRDPPGRHHHFPSGQGNAEAHTVRLQHLAGEDPAIPAHHIAEEEEAE